ncbi:glycosyltransferase family 2 protein [Sulfitobacter sp.]|uniref:glycosyltransferase family 2 protein n=1 Tax=Sulfitobacter sp. TaxID=1903071 RepID=UPI00300277EE
MTLASPAPADLEQLHASALFDAGWYLERYADVSHLGLAPLAHFERLGLALGRDPGPGFCSRSYLADNPDVAAAGIPALLHYLRSGRSEGRLPHPPAQPTLSACIQGRVGHLRSLLETGGLTEAPLAALHHIARDSPDLHEATQAREALALWGLHTGDADSAAHLLAGLGPAYAPLRLIAQTSQNQTENILYQSDSDNSDLHLAATRMAPDPDATLACLNRAFALSDLTVATLTTGEGPAFDRLQADAPPDRDALAPDAPLVSVLMAAHNAADVIGTAIQSVLRQSWRALELIVVDDASTDDTAGIVAAAATRDPRVRLIRLAHNRGAYGARNAALAEARGHYITLHDADDWSHPERLTRHAHFLASHPGHIGCLSTQARCTEDLRISRWTGTGAMAFENLTSLMLPREIFDTVIGVWDDVRVSADSELLRRVRRLFGAGSVPLLPQGPLALQRDSTGNATGDSATGMGWFYYGARQEYHEAQRHHHETAPALRYAAHTRPFPVPQILTSGPDRLACQTFDCIYAGVLSVQDTSLEVLLDWLSEDHKAGRSAALVPLYCMDQPVGGGLAIHPLLRRQIDGDRISVLCFGETARCTTFRMLPGQSPVAPHRYLPQVQEGETLVLSSAAQG